jgi:outer membrane protein TolC
VSTKIKDLHIPVLLLFMAIFLLARCPWSAAQDRPGYDPGDANKLMLDECIVIAMGNHLPLRIAEKQMKLAELRVLEAKRGMGPSVMGKWEETTGKVDGRHYAGRKFSVEGKQPIFYGGELVFSVKQAKLNLEIVKNDYNRIKNDLILQVKKAYYSLDRSKKALRLQQELLAKTREYYEITKAGYSANILPQLEHLKVSAQYNQVNFQATSAEEDVQVARLILQQSMNLDEEFDIVEIKEPLIIDIDLDYCYSLAYLNRPEIIIGQLSSEYFAYENKITRARAYWPRVDLLGSYGKANEQFAKQDRSLADSKRGMTPEFYVGTKVSWPIFGNTLAYSYTKEKWAPVVRTTQGTEAASNALTFSLFDRLAELSGVQETELELLRSQESAQAKQQEIELEVKEIFFQYKKAITLLAVARSKIAFQTRQVEILKVRLSFGEAFNSDVIEEAIKLAEEKFSHISAITEYYIAIASLNRAVGIDSYFDGR